jgi:lysophospholipase L1-like esterase
MRITLCFFIVFMGLTQLAHGAPRPKVVMAAIGDSITRAFNSGAPLAQPHRSWSLGYENGVVRSHRQRLEDMGVGVTAIDVSRSGAKSRDLAGQVGRLLRYNSLDYVSFLMGANDVCDWRTNHAADLRQYETNLRQAVSRLVNHSPNVKILMVAIPNMLNLYEVASPHRCQAKWTIMSFCPSLLGRNITALQRQYFGERLADANDALRTVADEFADNVKFVEHAATLEFEWRHISRIDCFHPSAAGQAYLADETWNHGWFAESGPQ